MRPEDIELANLLRERLIEFSDNVRPLPGIRNQYNRECLIEQMIDSTKRIKYVNTIRRRNISITCTQANSIAFDPFKAAVYFINQSNINEAFWMVFFGTHFGKHKTSKWNLASSIYGRVDPQKVWTWEMVSTNVLEFRHWLNENEFQVRGCGSFSNHRKYQSLGAYNERGTGATIASYVDWVGPERDHLEMIRHRFSNDILNDPKRLFNELFKSLSGVMGFGRTAKFDFLTMLGKLELLNIEPDSTYMADATGPKRGAKLLFCGDINATIGRDLETYIRELEEYLNLYFGMQVLEDSLCNWQKDPANYVHFVG